MNTIAQGEDANRKLINELFSKSINREAVFTKTENDNE